MHWVQDVSEAGSDEDVEPQDGKEAKHMVLNDEAKTEVQEGDEKNAKKRSKLDRLFNRKNNTVLSSAFVRMRAQDEDDMESDDNNGTDEDEFLQKKRPRKSLDEEDEDQEAKQMKAKRWVIQPSKPFIPLSV
jgi:ATP-dependent RNA helicase DDX10/DBP4